MSGFSDERWRDTYDEWKLRSPYDEDPYYDGEPECEHDEYEIDHEGRAECQRCDHYWWPSPQVVKAYDEAQRRYECSWDRYQRRENSWWMKAWRWLKRRVPNRQSVIGDDLPF